MFIFFYMSKIKIFSSVVFFLKLLKWLLKEQEYQIWLIHLCMQTVVSPSHTRFLKPIISFISLKICFKANDSIPGYGLPPTYRPIQNVKPYEAQVGLDPFPCNVPQTTQEYEIHNPLGKTQVINKTC
jgi:hypothetical protein